MSPARREVTSLAANLALTGPPAPAEFYGWVLPLGGISPTVGLRITAEIDGVLCGETAIETIDGQPAYHIQVASKLAEETPLCGEPGKRVTFKVATMSAAQTALWDNTQTQQVDLGDGGVGKVRSIYLPLINR